MKRHKMDLYLEHADGYVEKIRVTTGAAIRIIRGFLTDPGSSIDVIVDGKYLTGLTDAWNRFKVQGGEDFIV